MAERKPRNRVTRMLLKLSRYDADEIGNLAKAQAIDELEPRYKAVYEWCNARHREQRRQVWNDYREGVVNIVQLHQINQERRVMFTSEDVAAALGIKQNHASMLLAELAALGLMRRTRVEGGPGYVYRIAV